MSIFPSVDIHTGGSADYTDAAVIMVTAGAKQKTGEYRLDLMQRNASIVEEIVDEITARNSVLTFSVYVQGEYGINDVTLSVSCVFSGRGVERIIEGRLTTREYEALTHSASLLHQAAAALEGGKLGKEFHF